MAQRQHQHHIDVQTDEELVTVVIGSDGGVPGGFAKLFNRVVDSQAWARLSDAGRAAYIPLVRFADHRNQFRVQVGQAAIMKYAGLSRSSAKRAMKDLVANKLLVLIDRGGVSEAGENESNVYQLLVPTESRRRIGGSQESQTAGLLPAPEGVRQRTPSPSVADPPASPGPAPRSARRRTPSGDRQPAAPGATGGPQLRNTDKELSKTPPAAPGFQPRIAAAPLVDAAALLEEKGVEPLVARQLAATFPRERIVDVIATMQWRQSRGKCDNPGGFIRDALVKQWQTPRAVLDARAKAEARLRAEAAEQQARVASQREEARVGEEEARIERVIGSLEDEDLALLSKTVLEKYAGNAAVTAVLTRKPPRECRLMKMEIAAMLEQANAGMCSDEWQPRPSMPRAADLARPSRL